MGMFSSNPPFAIDSPPQTVSVTLPLPQQSEANSLGASPGADLILPPAGLSREQREILLRRIECEPTTITQGELRSLGQDLTAGRLSANDIQTLRSSIGELTNPQILGLADGIRERFSTRLPEESQILLQQLRCDLVPRFTEMLGSSVHGVRQAATNALIGLGPDICNILEQTRLSSNPEIAGRGNFVLRQIADTHGADLHRQLIFGSPEGRIRALRDVTHFESVRSSSGYARELLDALRGCQALYLREAFQGLERGEITADALMRQLLRPGNQAAREAASSVVNHLLGQYTETTLGGDVRDRALTNLARIYSAFPTQVIEGIGRHTGPQGQSDPLTSPLLLGVIGSRATQIRLTEGLQRRGILLDRE